LFVLHAAAVPDANSGYDVALWAEDSSPPVSSPSEALSRARPHPFAASGSTLAQLLPGAPETQTLLLPSLRRSPLDSPEMVRVSPRPKSSAGPSLLAWTVKFDDDPFTILAWRGREREDLLEHLETGTGEAETAAVPLTDLLEEVYLSGGHEVPPRPAGGGISVLEQLPPVSVKIRSMTLAQALRPGYAALTGAEDPDDPVEADPFAD